MTGPFMATATCLALLLSTPTLAFAQEEPTGFTLRPEARPWVEVQPVTERPDFTPEVHAPARFKLREGSVLDLSLPVTGRLTEVHIKLGDTITEGSPILTMESAEAAGIRAELAAARAEYQAAVQAKRRIDQLKQGGVSTELERAEATARMAQARVAYERAQRAAALLGEGEGTEVTLLAPISGTILSHQATKGAIFNPDDGPLVTLGDPLAVWIVAEPLERDLSQIQPGSRARVVSGLEIEGTVQRISATIDPSTRRAEVFIEPDTATLPRAGTWARVAISAQPSPGIVLPVEAVLIKSRGRLVVYVEKDGMFYPREVEIGQRRDNEILIHKGLKPSENVVFRGALLVDGQASLLL